MVFPECLLTGPVLCQVLSEPFLPLLNRLATTALNPLPPHPEDACCKWQVLMHTLPSSPLSATPSHGQRFCLSTFQAVLLFSCQAFRQSGPLCRFLACLAIPHWSYLAFRQHRRCRHFPHSLPRLSTLHSRCALSGVCGTSEAPVPS